jgi:CRP-like cAMP-binding protein/bacterioferritin-associated ferredoxin
MDTSVVTALQQSPLGAGCSPPELMGLARRLDAVELGQGASLFAAGDAADAAYVVLQGALEVRAADGTVLARPTPGALIGEQALLPDGRGTRNASVRALESSRLLRVEAGVFEELAASRSQRASLEEASFQRTRDRLRRMRGPLAALLAASEERSWDDGQVLFEEGDAADGLHLVLAGRAEIVTGHTGVPLHLSTVYPGAVFGELATLTGAPRKASVVARSGLRTAFVPLARARALDAAHPDLHAFLESLLRSYTLPSRGAVHQRTVFQGGHQCIETVYALGDGRTLRAVRDPSGRYQLSAPGDVAKELEIAPGTTVSLDGAHRIVGLQDAGGYAEISGLHALALDGTPLSLPQRRTLRKAARAAALHAPDAVICRCLNLDRATLEAAVRQGAGTSAGLQAVTGCGTVCGGCMKGAVPGLVAACAAEGEAGSRSEGVEETGGRADATGPAEARPDQAETGLLPWLRGLWGR